jgi:hypothetical protein
MYVHASGEAEADWSAQNEEDWGLEVRVGFDWGICRFEAGS